MIEKQIKIELIKRDLKPSDVYKALGLERAHFYQAICGKRFELSI